MGFRSLQAALDTALQQNHLPAISQPMSVDDAQRAWQTAIAAMDRLIQETLQDQPSALLLTDAQITVETSQGLIFSGPVPVFQHPGILTQFQTCLWVPKWWTQQQHQLLPSQAEQSCVSEDFTDLVPIPEDDPIAQEQFCLIRTRSFAWMALLSAKTEFSSSEQQSSKTNPHPYNFSISFEPNLIQAISQQLFARVEHYHPKHLPQLQQESSLFLPLKPHYSIPERYGRYLLTQQSHPPEPTIIFDWAPTRMSPSSASFNPLTELPEAKPPHQNQRSHSVLSSHEEVTPSGETQGYDLELLKAIAHEIRTPLSTIQTLTRLLLRRKDLSKDVLSHLTQIQQECVDQIDRFSLIFRAIELTSTPTASLTTSLTSISLQQILEEKIERWTTLLSNRSLHFRCELPDDLPLIAIRDPSILDQVLTGLIEQLSHTLPFGSHINLHVSLAGDQLKIQLQSTIVPSDNDINLGHRKGTSMLRAVGQLLMLQPDTGGLSLSLPATKKIFKFLGGKLTVRQSPPKGEIMTMFLPLDQP